MSITLILSVLSGFMSAIGVHYGPLAVQIAVFSLDGLGLLVALVGVIAAFKISGSGGLGVLILSLMLGFVSLVGAASGAVALLV